MIAAAYAKTIALSIEVLGLVQKPPEARGQAISIYQFALPNHSDPPSFGGKGHLFASITVAVGLDLGLPVLEPRFGKLANPAAVAVPEATVHE